MNNWIIIFCTSIAIFFTSVSFSDRAKPANHQQQDKSLESNEFEKGPGFLYP